MNSRRQYNKWEKEHIEELLPPQEIKALKKIEAVYKSWPLWKRVAYNINQLRRAIISRFQIWKIGKHTGKR